MPSPLVRTKLYVPRARHTVVPRARLVGRLSTSGQPRLTVVSGPAGFGKTTLLATWAGNRESPGGVGLARGDRAAVHVVLDLRRDGSGHRGAGAWRRGAAPAPGAPPTHGVGPRRSAQRPRRPGRRRGPDPRRLPPRRRAGDRRRRRLPGRAPSPGRARTDQHTRRPDACPWLGCGRAASWSRSGPPTCASRSTRSTAYLNDVAGLRPRRPRDRDARGPDRGLDRRPPAGCSLAAGAATTPPASSPGSPATTATSSTTSSRRSSRRQPEDVRASCSTPRSSTG